MRLPPAQFWLLTLPEIDAMIGNRNAGGGAVSRASFAAMIAAFPDKLKKNIDEVTHE